MWQAGNGVALASGDALAGGYSCSLAPKATRQQLLTNTGNGDDGKHVMILALTYVYYEELVECVMNSSLNLDI